MKRSLTNVQLVCLSIVACFGVPLSENKQTTLDVTERQTELAPPDLNINVGGTDVGRFMGDQYSWLINGANTDQFEKLNANIGGAEVKNGPMYKSHRYGKLDAGTTPWGYDIPVAEPGTYGCTVHFAETDSTAFKNGGRVFDLSIQGAGPATEFKGIDVFKETNQGTFVVLTKTAPKLVITGILKVRVAKTEASEHGAFIAGITCERTGDLPAGTEPAAPPAGAITPPSSATGAETSITETEPSLEPQPAGLPVTPDVVTGAGDGVSTIGTPIAPTVVAESASEVEPSLEPQLVSLKGTAVDVPGTGDGAAAIEAPISPLAALAPSQSPAPVTDLETAQSTSSPVKAETLTPVAPGSNVCDFVFCDGTSDFTVGKSVDVAFTGKICHKDGTIIGTVDESGEAYLEDGTRISKYSPTGLTQNFSPSFFKTASIKSTKYVHSGVSHETPQQNQGQFLDGKLWTLPIESYQVLNSKGQVTDELSGGCIKFSTRV